MNQCQCIRKVFCFFSKTCGRNMECNTCILVWWSSTLSDYFWFNSYHMHRLAKALHPLHSMFKDQPNQLHLNGLAMSPMFSFYSQKALEGESCVGSILLFIYTLLIFLSVDYTSTGIWNCGQVMQNDTKKRQAATYALHCKPGLCCRWCFYVEISVEPSMSWAHETFAMAGDCLITSTSNRYSHIILAPSNLVFYVLSKCQG